MVGKRRRPPVRTGPSWGTIMEMEQERWVTLAFEHQNDDELCAEIIAAGTATQSQAAQLSRIATERGWPIPQVGSSVPQRRPKRRT